MSKWEPVNPADLKPGDKVKCVERLDDHEISYRGVVKSKMDGDVHLGAGLWIPRVANKIHRTGHSYTWFRRKPKPPTRPAEPPTGTVVRNMVTGRVGWCDDDQTWRWYVGGVGWQNWKDWIVPGDTIEVAEWVKP